MHVRTDYETEDILAVFDDPERARAVIPGLRAELGDPHRVVAVPLPAGRYQLADTSLQEVVHDAMRAAGLSVPLGALAGLGPRPARERARQHPGRSSCRQAGKT